MRILTWAADENSTFGHAMRLRFAIYTYFLLGNRRRQKVNNVTIKSIIIDNFRGIRHATLAFDETKNEIVLPNGGGKTSIKLAFNW